MKGDKNNIFFNLIHYVLSEQANVNWILKTSLINFTGLSTDVNYSKFKKPNLINEILEYLTYIKPYHTKFDQFIEKYTSKNDRVHVLGDRKETTDGSFIVIHNLVEFFEIEEDIRFDNVTLEPDIEYYNSIKNDDEALKKFWNTTSANRLYSIVTKDTDKISELLHGGFKGLTVYGGDFLIDTYGYDSRLYDSSLYDAPNITYEYFIIDYNEPEYDNYVKEIVKVQTNLLKLTHPYSLTRDKIRIYSYLDGIRTEITEYNIIADTINIFRGIKQYEKIVVIVTELDDDGDEIKYYYIFEGIPFYEELTEADCKFFKEYGTTTFNVPNAEYGVKTMKVYLSDSTGKTELFTNYTVQGDKIVLNTVLDQYSILSICVIDYSYIYDKIYAYEDVYASNNNLMYLDGDGFLRPHWERGHPSELSIGRLHDSFFITKLLDDKILNITYFDYLRNTTYCDCDKGEYTELAKPLKMGDSEIVVNNARVLPQPYIKDNMRFPGVLLIDNEIIEYYSVSDNKLSSIKRATRGSSFKNSYPAGTVCWNYGDNNIEKTESNYDIISYTNKDTNYHIPNKLTKNSRILVSKISRVNMLNDLTPESTYVNFDNRVVVDRQPVIMKYKVNDLFKVARTDELGIVLGLNPIINISFNHDITTIEELVQYIQENIPESYSLRISADLTDNTITFNSYNGESLLIYNIFGYPVQAIFDGSTVGTVKAPTILANGTNGISVNGRKIIWGNYKYTIKYLKEHPYEATVNDMILSINNNKYLNEEVLARNNNDHLEIISLNGKDITYSSVGEDCLPIIGITENLDVPEELYYDNSYASVAIKKEESDYAGSVVINGEHIYFYSYNEYVQNNQIYSRIDDVKTDKTIKKDDAIILTPFTIDLVEGIDYTIDENNNVILNTPLQDYEALYISHTILSE